MDYIGDTEKLRIGELDISHVHLSGNTLLKCGNFPKIVKLLVFPNTLDGWLDPIFLHESLIRNQTLEQGQVMAAVNSRK